MARSRSMVLMAASGGVISVVIGTSVCDSCDFVVGDDRREGSTRIELSGGRAESAGGGVLPVAPAWVRTGCSAAGASTWRTRMVVPPLGP